ncbi:Apolipoprotein N-acyltransferase [Nonlabens sp. Hel1_33_55]|uniref:apolipoprotein N-acyltransferase n=1 Tax=Nonlabens sp. Hel1_33_55 TaxID=1336802 RepID=UPI000875B2C9|nr:apolipoprotein N-acyltransferase [Nonlabens sp. Hel1_33_55]SCX92922.1 Apolipoprotein N-acyltransferase [Nonlabens sp. Hel1_33_55]
MLKNFLLAILSGILFWLGWPTYGFPLLLFFAFIPLLIVEYNMRLQSAKATGWKVLGFSYLTFLIWNMATTSWLYFATPFGMWFAVLVNSLLMALVFWCYHLFARRATTGASLSFLACIWIGFEYLHLHWDFSWPWLNLGNGFSEYTSWIQWYEYTGTFGGTLWVLATNISLYLLWKRFRESETKFNLFVSVKVTRISLTLIGIPILISLFLKPDDALDGDTSEVVIIQPNIDPYAEKYNTDNLSIANLLLQLSQPYIDSTTDLIIAPETVLARSIELGTVELEPSVGFLQQYIQQRPNMSYLGGISLLERFRDEEKITTQSNYYAQGEFYYNDFNSALFLKDAALPELYHKSKLVVGVENFPYKSILQPILGDAMIDLGGTVATKTTQEDRAVFETAQGSKVAPIICYESVYGDYVSDYVKNGAQFLAIITNDAWWGNTQGHQQHLSLARLRAVETRRWIARSANTGISAVIAPSGTVTERLDYEKQGAIKATVGLSDELTFYSNHGDYIARIAMGMGIFILLFGIFKRGTMKRK